MTLRGHPCVRCGFTVALQSLVCESCGALQDGRVEASQPAVARSNLVPPAGAGRLAAREAEHDLRSVLQPDSAALEPIRSTLLGCSHIAQNASYSGVAEGCWVHCCLSPNPLHAYATGSSHTDSEAGSRRSAGTPCLHCDAIPPEGSLGTIVIPVGLLRFAGVLSVYVGAPLLTSRSSDRVTAARGRMRQSADCLREPDYMDGSAARSLVERSKQVGRDPAIRGLAADLARGTIAAVLAHEVGHLVYGHVDGPRSLLEVSRNAEREADSFAASVLLTMPHPERALLGSVLFWSCVIHRARVSGGERPVTHPLSGERLEAMIQSMPSAMRTIEALHALSIEDLRELAGIESE